MMKSVCIIFLHDVFELFRIVRFQISHLISQPSVANSMRLLESVHTYSLHFISFHTFSRAFFLCPFFIPPSMKRGFKTESTSNSLSRRAFLSKSLSPLSKLAISPGITDNLDEVFIALIVLCQDC